jgi:hypothetical protein
MSRVLEPENDSGPIAQLAGVSSCTSDESRNTSIATSTEAPESSTQMLPSQTPTGQLASFAHEFSIVAASGEAKLQPTTAKRANTRHAFIGTPLR